MFSFFQSVLSETSYSAVFICSGGQSFSKAGTLCQEPYIFSTGIQGLRFYGT